MIARISILSLILLLLVGCYNSADTPSIGSSTDIAVTPIATVIEDVVGNKGRVITYDVVVRGRVTSSDEQRNIYQSLFVEDETGALEVRVGLSPLYSTYPEGLDVALHLKGCRADYYRGVLQIGADALGEYVETITAPESVERVIRRGVDVKPREATEMRLEDLTPAMCGRLVRVDALRAVASTYIDTLAGETLEDAVWCGSALFKSPLGDSIAVYTSDYARYANHKLPLGDIAITGILEWGDYARSGKECYHIMMRYERDCESM